MLLKKGMEEDCWACEASDDRVAEALKEFGAVDNRLYAAALPYVLEGVAAKDGTLHRARVASEVAVEGLILYGM